MLSKHTACFYNLISAKQDLGEYLKQSAAQSYKDFMDQKKKKQILSANRKAEIAALADDILDMMRITGPEVDPLKIADDNQISWSQNNYSNDFLALIEYREEHFHIYINLAPAESLNSPRVRFSIAHELGHYFIPAHKTKLIAQGQLAKKENPVFVNDLPEKEADFFASCLLMPEKWLKPDFDVMELDLKPLKKLKKRYNTSTAALLSRYREIGKIPITMVWSQNGKINTIYPSKDFPFYNLNTGKNGTLPEHSIAYQNYFSNSNEKKLRGMACASDIFKTSKPNADEIFVSELCIPQDNKGSYLSVFWINNQID